MYLYGRLINSVLMCYQLHIVCMWGMCGMCGILAMGVMTPETMDLDPQIGYLRWVISKM